MKTRTNKHYERYDNGEVIEKSGYTFTVKFEVDEYPDLSFYGEYTDKPNWYDSDRYMIIDRKENRNMGRNEYRYFQCAYDMQDAAKWYKESGYCKHDCYILPRKHSLEDYERMEDYNKGDWCMLGIIVTCNETGEKESLWGCASDDHEGNYEIVQDLIAELLAPLHLEELQSRLEFVTAQLVMVG